MGYQEKKIRGVLEGFQLGYTKRDINDIDRFANEYFVDEDNTLIIGTGNGEWCRGIEQIKELLHIDWYYWGNFSFDFDSLQIKHHGTFATVAASAVLQKVYEEGKLHEFCVNRMKKILDDNYKNEEKVYQSLKAMAYYLHEEHVGKDTRRRVRFSATLKEVEGKWKFTDIHFSYPVTPPTDVKLIAE